MEDKKNLPQQYINTPFAYTKFSKNLTLLQQSMLVKVSEYLQDHVKAYFGSDLSKSRDIPRPLFSEAEKNSGIQPITVSYAELGVTLNNYSAAHEAVKDVLALTVDAPGKDKDGKPAIIKYNIFTEGNMSSDMSNGVVFSLNPKVVDYVFDMSQGYVTHPADIARIGQVERMPMMYYYLFKKSARWKDRIVHLSVREIKEYLGMYKVVTEADIPTVFNQNVDDEKKKEKKSRGRPLEALKVGDVKEAYPKFSKFNSLVLAKSIDDINRLKQEGLLDICVSYEPIYNGKRKVGNPAFIKFCIYDTIEEMQKASGVGEQPTLFEEVKSTEPVKPENVSQHVIEPQDEKNRNIWQSFLLHYEGKGKEHLAKMQYLGITQKGELCLKSQEEDIDAFESDIKTMTQEEKKDLLTRWSKHTGRNITGVVYKY